MHSILYTGDPPAQLASCCPQARASRPPVGAARLGPTWPELYDILVPLACSPYAFRLLLPGSGGFGPAALLSVRLEPVAGSFSGCSAPEQYDDLQGAGHQVKRRQAAGLRVPLLLPELSPSAPTPARQHTNTMHLGKAHSLRPSCLTPGQRPFWHQSSFLADTPQAAADLGATRIGRKQWGKQASPDTAMGAALLKQGGECRGGKQKRHGHQPTCGIELRRHGS